MIVTGKPGFIKDDHMKYTRDVLIVEDDKNLRWMLKENLHNEGFVPFMAVDGEEAAEMLASRSFSLYILDIMLPGKDGLTLAREIRQRDKCTPILFLTARSMKHDVLEGFKLGADDYVVKPFDIDELIWRMKALMRRAAEPIREEAEPDLAIGCLKLIPDQRLLTVEGRNASLSPKEASLLELLARNPNRTIPRQEILLHVWGRDDEYTSKSLDVYLTRIRKFLDNDDGVFIRNIRGLGYRLECEQ